MTMPSNLKQNQSKILAKITEYLQAQGNRSEEFIQQVISGYCNGISSLWLLAQTGSYKKFQEIIELILQWDGPAGKEIKEIEQFINDIEWLQNLQTYTIARQNDLRTAMAIITDNDKKTISREYYLIAVLNLGQIKQLLATENLIQEDKMIMLKTHDHATAIYKKNGKYYYFDPNSTTGQIECMTTDEMATLIVQCNFKNFDEKLNIEDNGDSFLVSFDMFSFEGDKHLPYPDKETLYRQIKAEAVCKYSYDGCEYNILERSVHHNDVESLKYFLKQGAINSEILKDVFQYALLCADENDKNDENCVTLLINELKKLKYDDAYIINKIKEKLSYCIAEGDEGRVKVIMKIYSDFFQDTEIDDYVKIEAKSNGRIDILKMFYESDILKIPYDVKEKKSQEYRKTIGEMLESIIDECDTSIIDDKNIIAIRRVLTEDEFFDWQRKMLTKALEAKNFDIVTLLVRYKFYDNKSYNFEDLNVESKKSLLLYMIEHAVDGKKDIIIKLIAALDGNNHEVAQALEYVKKRLFEEKNLSYKDVFMLFIEQGCNIDDLGLNDNQLISLLNYAVQSGEAEVVEKLIEKKLPNADQLISLLNQAIIKGNTGVAEKLIEKISPIFNYALLEIPENASIEQARVVSAIIKDIYLKGGDWLEDEVGSVELLKFIEKFAKVKNCEDIKKEFINAIKNSLDDRLMWAATMVGCVSLVKEILTDMSDDDIKEFIKKNKEIIIGADIIEAFKERGCECNPVIALKLAMQDGNINIVREFIDKNPTLLDDNSQIKACIKYLNVQPKNTNKIAILELLIEKNILRKKEKPGKYEYLTDNELIETIVRIKGCENIASMLIKSDSVVYLKFILEKAIAENRADLIEKIFAQVQINSDIDDNDIISLYNQVVAEGKFNIAALFLKNDIPVDKLSPENQKALLAHAVSIWHTDIIKNYIKIGSICIEELKDALALAIKNKRNDVILMFLENDYKVNVLDDATSKSLLFYAINTGKHENIIQDIIESFGNYFDVDLVFKQALDLATKLNYTKIIDTIKAKIKAVIEATMDDLRLALEQDNGDSTKKILANKKDNSIENFIAAIYRVAVKKSKVNIIQAFIENGYVLKNTHNDATVLLPLFDMILLNHPERNLIIKSLIEALSNDQDKNIYFSQAFENAKKLKQFDVIIALVKADYNRIDELENEDRQSLLEYAKESNESEDIITILDVSATRLQRV